MENKNSNIVDIKDLKNNKGVSLELEESIIKNLKGYIEKKLNKADAINLTLSKLKLNEEKFDIIVSNPPYIKTNVIKNLDIQVQNEPFIALDGGKDGFDFYKKIINESYQYLKYNGYLCLEIGFDQKIDVIELIENTESFTGTYSKKDLFDNDRIIVTRLK